MAATPSGGGGVNEGIHSFFRLECKAIPEPWVKALFKAHAKKKAPGKNGAGNAKAARPNAAKKKRKPPKKRKGDKG